MPALGPCGLAGAGIEEGAPAGAPLLELGGGPPPVFPGPPGPPGPEPSWLPTSRNWFGPGDREGCPARAAGVAPPVTWRSTLGLPRLAAVTMPPIARLLVGSCC